MSEFSLILGIVIIPYLEFLYLFTLCYLPHFFNAFSSSLLGLIEILKLFKNERL